MFSSSMGGGRFPRGILSVRPTSIPYNSEQQQQQPRTCEHLQHQAANQQRYKLENIGGPKLWRQMMIGFTCAALVGLLMFVLGSAFIADAVHSKYSVSIMLCIMGMVCGLIVLVGVVILGRLFISRKWRFNSNQTQQHPNPACFHNCSVIYTPSQDQYPAGVCTDPPPAYDTIPTLPGQGIQMTTIIHPGHTPTQTSVEVHRPVQLVMPKPPKYSDAVAPLPPYGDPV